MPRESESGHGPGARRRPEIGLAVDQAFGFDAFARKWVPAPPDWADSNAAERGSDGATEDERRRTYLAGLVQAGRDRPRARDALADRVRREFAAGVTILAILDGLLEDPEMRQGAARAAFLQRAFGIPLSRARYVASWDPDHRSAEALKVLERVSLCIADARRAGLWSGPDEER